MTLQENHHADTSAAGSSSNNAGEPTPPTAGSASEELRTTTLPAGNLAPKATAGQLRNGLVFGAVGLVVGLAAGWGLGQLEFPSASHAIPDAADTCGVAAAEGISVMDEGSSISMQTAGSESTGASHVDVTCVLVKLKTPESVLSRIDSTRALDGRQTADWDQFSASWGYHPDNGLDIVVEAADSN